MLILRFYNKNKLPEAQSMDFSVVYILFLKVNRSKICVADSSKSSVDIYIKPFTDTHYESLVSNKKSSNIARVLSC